MNSNANADVINVFQHTLTQNILQELTVLQSHNNDILQMMFQFLHGNETTLTGLFIVTMFLQIL
jgi:hypothetical protein